MKWADFKPGMFVVGEADDHFQILEGTLDEADRTEYPFTFAGRIESITQRRVIIDGWWRWACDPEECDENDPEETRGRFGIIRGGILVMHRLSPAGAYRAAD